MFGIVPNFKGISYLEWNYPPKGIEKNKWDFLFKIKREFNILMNFPKGDRVSPKGDRKHFKGISFLKLNYPPEGIENSYLKLKGSSTFW